MGAFDRNMIILIADNDDGVRSSTKYMLEQFGYEKFIEVHTGEGALNRLHKNKVDMIFCEAKLPDMSGVDILRAVRDNEELKEIPFFMITADSDQATVAEAGEVEVDAYILKPFTPKLIKDKIKQVQEGRSTSSPTELHLNLGQVYLKARQFEKAMAEFQKASNINFDSPRVLLAIGQLREQQGDQDEAGRCYHKAVSLSSQFLKGYDALAGLCESQGDLESAAGHLKKAAGISPRNVDRLVKLGQALIGIGRKKEAVEVFKKALTTAKDRYSGVARQVADAYLVAGMMAEAESVLVEVLSFNPNDIHMYNQLGIAFRKQKKYREAAKNYERAIKIDPEDENLYYNLGRACYDAGDRDKSAEAMSRALQLCPDFEEARDFMTKVLKQ